MELKILKKNAISAFNKADKAGKALLTELLGKDVLSEKITERIKTFQDVLDSIEVTDNVRILLDYNGIDCDMLGAKALLKLSLIRRVLNEGWEPDWNDSSESKYYPWFNNYKSGVGFSSDGFVCGRPLTGVGSRLVFKSEELSKYAGTQFVELYREYMLYSK